ncbi:response regulator [Aerosakkonemataceae cyanobacterium BLCC-F154]|uniref:Response regulator n=1 Tax=Floridaenema fluviatile BLCC-F154 TaxID=3153640 RepID=A0ABV4YFX9_9CYAN
MVNFNKPVHELSSLPEAQMEPLTTKRILIVEDEPNLRRLVQTCLETLGEWEVIQAASGYEGLLLAEREKPDAVLLDAMMPEMDGITFLQTLLTTPEIQTIPVVFLTAKEDLIEPESYLPLGARGAIAKPFNPLTLHHQVAAFLGWHSE